MKVGQRFSIGALPGEAARNVATAGTAGWLSVAVSALAAAGIVIASVSQVGALSDAHDLFLQRGGAIARVTPIDDAALDAQRCEELNKLPGVVAAGGVANERVSRMVMAPQVSVVVVEGTPSLARVFWPDSTPQASLSSSVAGHDISERFGLAAGGMIELRSNDGSISTLQVGAGAPAGIRNDSLDRTIFVPSASVGRVGACLVEMEVGATRPIANILVGWFGERVGVSPYAQVEGPSAAGLVNRLSRFLPVGAALVILAMFASWVWSRRGDHALYRLLGLTTPQLLIMVLVEYTLIVLLPVSWGICAALAFSRPALADPLVLQAVAADLAVLGASLMTVPAVVLGVSNRRNVVGDLKGR
ncbi:ABC transporter permease [Pseudolysinimonas sp.]